MKKKLMTRGLGLMAGIALMLAACGNAAQVDHGNGKAPEAAFNAETEQPEGSGSQAKAVGERNGTGTSTSFAVKDVKEKQEAQKELEISEYGWNIVPNRYDETLYVNFCALVHNPNMSLKAEFPEVIATIRNGEGEILATGSQTGGYIMPQDTVTLIGRLSLPRADVSEGTKIGFDVECSRFSTVSAQDKPKTTDFIIENVSERGSGWDYKITGEVTNNTSAEVDRVLISILLRKEGEIVYMEISFLDSLQPGKAKPFEVSYLSDVPEHDTIDVSVQAW